MSTNRSVGRSASSQAKVRSTATHIHDRFTSTSKKDRSRLCTFAFADGRQCRTPRCSGHLHLCYFHAQKEAERLAAKQVGEDISRFLPAKLLTACDLSAAMARVFCAIARGDVKPKVASTLAYLSQSMVQSIPIAQHEYSEAFGSDAWRREIRASFNVPAPQPKPAPQPTPKPAPPATSSVPKPAPQPTPQLASQPAPPQPPTLPHKPLPPTSTEFAQQVLAGRNSSRSPIPTPSGPGRETGSSPATLHVRPTSPNPQPAELPANCNSERSDERPTSGASPESYREESAFSSSPVCHAERSEASHPFPTTPLVPPEAPVQRDSPPPTRPSTPPAPQSTSPQQSQPTHNSQHNSLPAPAPPAPPSVPPGFGAPANWDVLIPPKTRRRFSRLP